MILSSYIRFVFNEKEWIQVVCKSKIMWCYWIGIDTKSFYIFPLSCSPLFAENDRLTPNWIALSWNGKGGFFFLAFFHKYHGDPSIMYPFFNVRHMHRIYASRSYAFHSDILPLAMAKKRIGNSFNVLSQLSLRLSTWSQFFFKKKN
jgi:hypothetical protein